MASTKPLLCALVAVVVATLPTAGSAQSSNQQLNPRIGSPVPARYDVVRDANDWLIRTCRCVRASSMSPCVPSSASLRSQFAISATRWLNCRSKDGPMGGSSHFRNARLVFRVMRRRVGSGSPKWRPSSKPLACRLAVGRHDVFGGVPLARSDAAYPALHQTAATSKGRRAAASKRER